MCKMPASEKLYQQADACLYGKNRKCDYPRALALFHQAAEMGSLKAKQALARIYRDGEIVSQDLERSLSYYEQCAASGDAASQFVLANLYHRGEFFPQDLGKALFWYQKAAEQGHDKAQNNLANLYKLGSGAPQDYIKAMYWYHKSAEAGNGRAEENLKKLVEYDACAMYALGMHYLQQQDKETALNWLQKAAERNHPAALETLGDLALDSGRAAEAFSYYKRSARQGCGSAAEKAGDYLRDTSLRSAEKYYKLAVESGSESAIQKLAGVYLDERRFWKQPKKAEALLQKTKRNEDPQ